MFALMGPHPPHPVRIRLYFDTPLSPSTFRVNVIIESLLIILKPLLNIQMIWMIFIKLLKNTIQIKNVKY